MVGNIKRTSVLAYREIRAHAEIERRSNASTRMLSQKGVGGADLQGLLTKANLDLDTCDITLDSEAWYGFKEYVGRLLDALQEVGLLAECLPPPAPRPALLNVFR